MKSEHKQHHKNDETNRASLSLCFFWPKIHGRNSLQIRAVFRTDFQHTHWAMGHSTAPHMRSVTTNPHPLVLNSCCCSFMLGPWPSCGQSPTHPKPTQFANKIIEWTMPACKQDTSKPTPQPTKSSHHQHQAMEHHDDGHDLCPVPPPRNRKEK
jgi:hypothetical protein